MYKLLLVSDRPKVLEAFDRIKNWELLGFKAPHIRHDFEGAKESLIKHHADGIAIAVSDDEENKIMDLLRTEYPDLSIFNAGSDPDEVRRYVSELGILLNRTHADFSNDSFGVADMLQLCRHDFFRKLMAGQVANAEVMQRNLRLMRSKMDPKRSCVMVEMAQPEGADLLSGRWHYGPERLELALRNFFGKEINGWLILPTVLNGTRILMLSCPMVGYENLILEDSMSSIILRHTEESIAHVKEYLGLDLRISGIRVLPDLSALCADKRKDM